MNRNFLKRVPVTFIALAASASVFAASDTDSRLQQLEQQMKQIRTETAAGTFGAKTASARAEVDGKGAFFTIDALVWKAAIGGTDFAYTDTTDSIASFPIKGRMKYNDFGWDWGVRVGAGYNFDYDGWEGAAEYTYFDTISSEKTAAGPASSIVPLKGSADINGEADGFDYCKKAKSNYKFNFNNVDVDLARNYFVSKDLSFRPHFGLKSSWITLTQKVSYGSAADVPSSVVSVHDKNDLWAIGPNAGLNSRWHLCNGFGIFADASGSLLWGYYKVSHNEKESSDSDQSIRILAPMHRFCPNAQLAIGLSYDRYINNDKQHISATLGWETIYYFRANQSLKIDDFASRKYSRYSEDVSMQGVTLSLRFDF